MSLSISTSLRLSVTEHLALARTEELLFRAVMLIVHPRSENPGGVYCPDHIVPLKL